MLGRPAPLPAAGHAKLADPSQYEALESDLVFLGLAGLQDPPRPEVRGQRHAGSRRMISAARMAAWPGMCLQLGVRLTPGALHVQLCCPLLTCASLPSRRCTTQSRTATQRAFEWWSSPATTS